MPNQDPASLYEGALLFMAAIRLRTHQEKSPPTLDDVCRLLKLSAEHGGFICRRLSEIGAIEAVAGAYGTRLFIRDHLKAEDLPREVTTDRMTAEVARFQSAQKEKVSKVESMRAEQKKKQQNLFAEMEKKLKAEIEKKTSS